MKYVTLNLEIKEWTPDGERTKRLTRFDYSGGFEALDWSRIQHHGDALSPDELTALNQIIDGLTKLRRDEHPDNLRFLADVEQWIGQPVIRLSGKYASVDDVFAGERYMVGVMGAACTRCMKREVAATFAKPGDIDVIGYTAEESQRAKHLTERHPDRRFCWILIAASVTKADCYRIVQAAGIKLPEMYRLGYDHNNCIGCVKGGKGYWNKIRRDFPEVFAKRAAQQREIGCAFRSGGNDFYLDELKPDEGRDVKEPDIECGVFCSAYEGVLSRAISNP